MAPRRAPATADLLALATLLGAVVLFFAPVWARGRVFLSDGQLAAFFDPVTAWSDAWLGGWPVLADPASYALYPVRLVLRGLGSFNAFVIAGYAIAAAGLFAYLRILGIASPAAALGALGFVFSGFPLGHLEHTTMVHTAAWLTPALAAIEATLAGSTRRGARATAAAVCLLCLAGHSQLVTYALVQLALYLAFRFVRCRREQRVRAWWRAVAGVAIGIALAAPALALTLAYLPETPRKTLTYARFAASAALPVEQLPSFFFPFLWGGGPAPYELVYFGKWKFAGVATYVPSIVVLLAAAGVGAGPMRLGLVWTAIGTAAALLTVGDGIPRLAETVYGLPGLGLFRAQGRHAFEVDLALAVLAAFGFDALMRGGRARTWLVPVTIVGVAFVSAFAWVAMHYHAIVVQAGLRRVSIPEWRVNPAVWVPVGLAFVALVAFAVAATSLPRRAKVLAVFAVFGVEAIGFGWWAPWVSEAKPRAALAPTLIERLVMEEVAAQPGRIVNVQGALGMVLTPERSRLFGLPSLNWYGPLAPARAATLLRASPFGAVDAQVAEPSNLVLDLYGVRYLVIDSLVDDYHYVLRESSDRWRMVARGDGSVVHENRRARPLAWLVGEWQRVTDPEALTLLQGELGEPPTFDVADRALVARLAPEEVTGFDAGRVEARWLGATVLDVTSESRSGGLLVIAVNHLPGWTATVDGAPADLERAFYAISAVRVPAGRHVVRLRYAPPGLAIGIAIGLAGLVGFVAVGARALSVRSR